MSTDPAFPALDAAAVARWPLRAASHLLGVGLVVAVLVALPVALTDLDRHQLPKETVVHLTTWLAVLLARPPLPRGSGRAVWWGLSLLVFVSAVSAALATNPWLGFRATSLTITLTAAFLTARHLASHRAGSALNYWCLIAVASGALSGIAQAYGLESPLFATTRVPGGTFGNRNFLAHFCALALPMVTITTLSARNRRRATLGTLLAAVLLALILLTRSRAAILGALSGGTILVGILLIARQRSLPIVPGRVRQLVIACGIGLLLAMLLPNSLEWRTDSPTLDTLTGLTNYKEGSGGGRMRQYRNSLELAMLHPVLGVGPGNWPIMYPEVAPPSDPSFVRGDIIPLNPWPSSDWMALISERGAIAFFGVLLVGFALCLRVLGGVRAGGDRALAGAGLLSMMAVLCVEGSFDAVALLAAPGTLMAIGAGLLLARTDGEINLEPSTDVSAPRWAPALILVLGMITLRSVMQTSSYLIAGKGFNRSRLVLAAEIDPGSYALRMALASKGSCKDARAALRLAPMWPAPKAAARRCRNE